MRLWGVDGSAGLVLRGHECRVEGVSFSPDGRTIASVSRDNTVRLWGVDGTEGLILNPLYLLLNLKERNLVRQKNQHVLFSNFVFLLFFGAAVLEIFGEFVGQSEAAPAEVK